MQPDSNILSILNRYENNLPVTTEEKAVLHKWLVKSLQTKEQTLRMCNIVPMKVTTIRKKVLFWQYAFIILMLLAMTFTLYLFFAKAGEISTTNTDGNLYRSNQEVRKPR